MRELPRAPARHGIAYASAVDADWHCLVHSTVYGTFKFDGAEIFERGAELSKSQCAEILIFYF